LFGGYLAAKQKTPSLCPLCLCGEKSVLDKARVALQFRHPKVKGLEWERRFRVEEFLFRFAWESGIVLRGYVFVKRVKLPADTGRELHFPKTSFNKSVTRAAGSVRIFFSSWATT